MDNNSYVYFISAVVGLGGFLFGYDNGIMTGAQILIRNWFHLSPNEFGLVMGTAWLGCLVGPTLGGILCDRWGTKQVLFLAGGLFIVGTAGATMANFLALFLLARLITGLAIGLVSVASPMYLVEIAPSNRRGRLVFIYQLAITVGGLLGVVVAWSLARSVASAACWRFMMLSTLLPVLVFLSLLPRVPQSPRWLVSRSHGTEAVTALRKIFVNPQLVEEELERIKTLPKTECGSLSILLAPGMRLVLITGVLLACFNSLTGATGLTGYLPTLFQLGGFERVADAIGVTLIPLSVNVFSTLIAMWLVDRIGRRTLWISTSTAMAILLILIGVVFHLGLRGPVVIMGAVLMLIPHAFGLGPLPWLMISEIFPAPVRAKAVSLCTTVLWLSGFTSIMVFPGLLNLSLRKLGSPAGIFWVYAIICVFAIFFGLTILPETRNRPLEEISRRWER